LTSKLKGDAKMKLPNIKLGLIGAGNMGSALIKGVYTSKLLEPNSIYVYDIDKARASSVSKEVSAKVYDSSTDIAKTCNVIIVAVKPQHIITVLNEINPYLTKGQVVISIAAGVSISRLRKAVDDRCDIIRVMPNTPALIGEGITSICTDERVAENNMQIAKAIFSTCGIVEYINEESIHAATAIGGSSPAYVYQFIEAMADGGVLMGLSREQSYRIASQALIGAAKMLQETGKHPGELKDMVCSPGGTTIEAVASLENSSFRSSIIEAIRVCAQKSKALEGN
jgi:pyrroline-5-carboxylate reductase